MHEGELAAIRFGGLARAESSLHVVQLVRIAFERGREFVADVTAARVLRKPRLQGFDLAQVPREHELAPHLEREFGLAGVTLGFPSRSPPIQLANRKNVGISTGVS